MAISGKKPSEKMSLHQTGKLGDEKRDAGKYGKEGLSQQTKKGAEGMKGKQKGEGGEQKYGKEQFAEQAKKGAQSVGREGSKFQSEIGKKTDEFKGRGNK